MLLIDLLTGPPVPFDAGDGPLAGYYAGLCQHRVARQEWAAGFRVCERCPSPWFAPDLDELPDLAGFDIHYDTAVTDDPNGDYLALGHVGVLRAFAAFRALARTYEETLPDPRSCRPALAHIGYRWAVNTGDLDTWRLTPAAPGDAGAFPITCWSRR